MYFCASGREGGDAAVVCASRAIRLKRVGEKEGCCRLLCEQGYQTETGSLSFSLCSFIALLHSVSISKSLLYSLFIFYLSLPPDDSLFLNSVFFILSLVSPSYPPCPHCDTFSVPAGVSPLTKRGTSPVSSKGHLLFFLIGGLTVSPPLAWHLMGFWLFLHQSLLASLPLSLPLPLSPSPSHLNSDFKKRHYRPERYLVNISKTLEVK